MYMCKKSLKLFINLETNNLKLYINGYISSIERGTKKPKYNMLNRVIT